MSFNQDILSRDTSLYPVIIINKDEDNAIYISTNSTTIGDQYYSPILLNVPSLKESIDIEKRNYKISNVTLSISNYEHNGKIFSDMVGNSSLINQTVDIYWISPSVSTIGDGSGDGDNAKHIYKGWVLRYDMDSDNVKLTVEDRSQVKLDRELPELLPISKEVPKEYQNKPIPMVYGHVKNSPCVISSSPFASEESIETGNITLLLDRDDTVTLDGESPLQLYLTKYITVPSTADKHDFSEIDTYTTGEQWTDNQNEISFNSVGVLANIAESETDTEDSDFEDTAPEGNNSIANNNIIAYNRAYPSEVIPRSHLINDAAVGGRYSTTNSHVLYKPSETQPSGYPVLSATFFKESTANQAEMLGSLTTNYAILHSAANEIGGFPGGLSDDVTHYTFDDDETDNSIVGCDFKMNIATGDILAENGWMSCHIKVNAFESAIYNDFDEFKFYLRMGGKAGKNDYIKVNGETPPSGTLSSSENDTIQADPTKRVDNPLTISQLLATDFAVEGLDTNHTPLKLTGNIGQLNFYLYIYNKCGGTGLEIEFPHIYVDHYMLLENMHSKTYYANVRGRRTLDSDIVEEKVQSIIADILYKECKVLHSDILIPYNEIYDQWKYAFTINKKIQAKSLIQKLASASPYLPRYNKDGKFTFSLIEKYYTSEKIDSSRMIEESDCISYSYSRTDIEQIYTKIIFKYNWDYAIEDFQSTPIELEISDLGQFVGDNIYERIYYGLTGDDDSTLEIDDHRGKYINDPTTAEAFAKWMLYWHCNQHLKIKLRLPLKYMDIEIGDTLAFDKVLGGVNPFGIRYDRDAFYTGDQGFTFRGQKLNGQQAFPLFLCTDKNTTLEWVEISCIQLHSLMDDAIPEGAVVGAMSQSALNFSPDHTWDDGSAVFWQDFNDEICPYGYNPNDIDELVVGDSAELDPDVTYDGTVDEAEHIFVFPNGGVATNQTAWFLVGGGWVTESQLSTYWERWNNDQQSGGQDELLRPEVYLESDCTYEDTINHELESAYLASWSQGSLLQQDYSDIDYNINLTMNQDFLYYPENFGSVNQLFWLKLQENNPDNTNTNLIVTLISLEAGFNDDGSVEFQDTTTLELINLTDINLSHEYSVSMWTETITGWENFWAAILGASGSLLGRAKIHVLLNVDPGGSNITEIDKTYTINYTSETVLVGDLNGDGVSNILDVTMLSICMGADT